MTDALAALKTQAVGEWEVEGDCYFARETLYDMAWGDFDPEGKRLALAPYGGPIAAIRDERRIVMVGVGAAGGDGGLRPVLRTFTAAGAALGAAVWEGGRLVDWGWTEEQELLTVEANGKVTVFSPFAVKLRDFTFGAAVEREGVASAAVYGGGVVVVTEPQQAGPGGPLSPGAIWVVADPHDPRPVRMAPIPPAAYGSLAAGVAGGGGGPRPGLPHALAVMDPRHTLSTGVEVFVAVGAAIYQLDDRSATDHQPPALRSAAAAAPAAGCGPVRHMALSPDGSCLALYTADDRLVVLSADLAKQLTEFEVRCGEGPPEGMHWVGGDAVLLTWPATALLVGPYGDSAQWALAEEVAVVSELDGCRLLGRGRHEVVRKVADCSVQVFRPGSTAPAAQLWDARALYDEENPRCDRILRNILDSGPAALPSAVRTCIEAAGHDLAPPRQRALMRAAAYGRPFCPPDFPRQLMYGVACRLRVLNAVRDPRVGLPLTFTQLEALSLPVLVARLIAYRQWLLAYRIAGTLRNIPGAQPTRGSSALAAGPGPSAAAAGGGALGLRPVGLASQAGGPPALALLGQDTVLVAWACAKISAAAASATDDAQLKDAIVAKLKGCPQVRYAPLAAHALSVGRRRLALRLLEEERSAAQQVPLLLSLAVGAGAAGMARQGHARAQGGEAASAGAGGEEGDEEVLQRALRKSIESGDTDLVYLVLFGLYRALPAAEFWALAASRALPRNLFIKYCRAKEPELLETFLTAAAAGSAGAGPHASAAAAAFPPAAAAAELAALQARGAMAAYVVAHAEGGAGEAAHGRLLGALGDASQKFGQSRDCAFQSKALADLAALRREQARLEREAGQRLFVGLSLADTLRQAIRLGNHKAAAALKKQFAVSDRRFVWIKVRTLAEAREWEALEAYATELRRSSIGWEPFIEAAKKWNAPVEYKARLVARLPDSPAKAEEYSALGLAREAAEVAAKIKDSDLFARIQSAVAVGSPAGQAIAQIRERFQSTFR